MSNLYSNKSTASRELGKMGIPREMRGDLIKNDHAPFAIDDKAVRKVLKQLKAEKKSNEAIVAAVDEAISEQAKYDNKLPEVVVAVVDENKEVKEVITDAPIVSAVTKQQADKRAKRTSNRQNGKTHPQRGVCAAIWEELDNFVKDMSGQIPTPAEAQQMGIANNWHKVTVYRQYNDWKTYHNYSVAE